MTQFPNSPSVGQTVTFGTLVYEWNGTAWISLGSISVGPTGATGNTGSQGIQGVTGNTGADSTVVGPTGAQGPAGAGSGGSTLSSGDGLTLSTNVAGVGYTLGIDPTAVVHVAGISADGGITAGSGKIGRITFDDNAIRLINGASVINTSGAWTYYGTSELGLFPNGSSNQGLSITTARTKAFQVIHAVGGISADAGITFPDGTHQTSAAPRTSSYTGHIEEASIKEYTLDPVAATARTITGFYIQSGNQSGSGGGSGTFILKVKPSGESEVTVKSVAVSNSSGAQSSLANTSVAADARIFLHCTATSSAVDVVFSVEYSL